MMQNLPKSPALKFIRFLSHLFICVTLIYTAFAGYFVMQDAFADASQNSPTGTVEPGVSQIKTYVGSCPILSAGEGCDNGTSNLAMSINGNGCTSYYSGDLTSTYEDNGNGEYDFYVICDLSTPITEEASYSVNASLDADTYASGLLTTPTPLSGDSSFTIEAAQIVGCTDPAANNYNPAAVVDDSSCTYDPPTVPGCTDPAASNYNPSATEDDNSCEYDNNEIPGCTDPSANNYDPEATESDGSCTYDDTDPPVFTSAAIVGNALVISFDESLDSATVQPSDITIDYNGVQNCLGESGSISGQDVVMTMTCTVDHGDTVTVSYTANSGWIRDLTGNGTPTFVDEVVTNNTADTDIPGCTDITANNFNPEATVNDGSCSYDDTTPPEFFSGTINNTEVIVTFNEPLDTTAVGNATDFRINFSGTFCPGQTISGISNDSVTIIMECGVSAGDTVTLNYTNDSGWLRDSVLNPVSTFSNQSLTNNTAEDPIFGCTDPEANNYDPDATSGDGSCTYDDATAPEYVNSIVNGTQLTVSFNENLATGIVVVPSDFGVINSTRGRTCTGISGSITGGNVNIVTSCSAYYEDELILSYMPSTGWVRDTAGNAVGSIIDEVISNGTAQDTTAPTLTLSSNSSSEVNGTFGVTATASEVLSEDFDILDLIVTNGTISNFSTNNNISYTFNVAPINFGAVRIYVATSTFTDYIGNANTAGSNVLNRTYVQASSGGYSTSYTFGGSTSVTPGSNTTSQNTNYSTSSTATSSQSTSATSTNTIPHIATPTASSTLNELRDKITDIPAITALLDPKIKIDTFILRNAKLPNINIELTDGGTYIFPGLSADFGGLTASNNFDTNIELGTKAADIINLQKFLNAQGFTVSKSGPGSIGNETSYFGVLTRAAVQTFQRFFNIEPADGTLNPNTRAFINSLLDKESQI